MVSIPGVIALSTPTLVIVALPLLQAQVPPGAASVYIVNEPVHTDVGPTIVPALGAGLMLIVCVATAVPQKLLTVYIIVSMPGVIPVTRPLVLLIVALPFVAVHTPPGDVDVNVTGALVHTSVGPDIVPAVGIILIAMGLMATAVPQLLVALYFTVSNPTDTGVTTPPLVIVAAGLLMLHTPLVAVFV
jgi:hypothetical protein